MSAPLSIFALGVAGGVAGHLLTAWAAPRLGRMRYLFSPDASRWSPEDATRIELRLNKRLGRPYPARIAVDASLYALWRAGLARATFKRLFEDAKLRLQGRSGEGLLIWGQLSIDERRLLLRCLLDHFSQRLFGHRSSQQFPDQCPQGDDLRQLDGRQVGSVDHPDLSCVSQPGDDAESPGRETDPATERGVLVRTSVAATMKGEKPFGSHGSGRSK